MNKSFYPPASFTNPFLSLSVIQSAQYGNAEAIHLILKQYEPYMKKLALRFVYDANGTQQQVVDYYTYRRLETKLITAILKFL